MTDGRSPGHPFAGAGLALVANKKPARTASPILRQLFARIDETGLAGRVIHKQTGIHFVTMSRWKHGCHSPKITDFEIVANALGLKLVLVPIEEDVGSDDPQD